MADFIPWNSQPLESWRDTHALGKLVDLNGRCTHYVERGEGPPVILVHGYLLDSRTWLRNLDALAEHFRVLAVDLWGFGYSTREPLDYGYALYAEQILQFMDALGIPSASIVGHSMGGGIAISVAANHPERVHKLILVGATGMPHPLPLRSRLLGLPGVAEFLMGLDTDAFRRKNLGDLWLPEGYELSSAEFESLVGAHKVEGSTEVMASVVRRRFFDTLGPEVEQLATLDIPTLIVWGDQDRMVPLHCGEEMHAILKDSQLRIFEGSGHMPCYDQSQGFNALAIEFLS